MQSNDRNSFCSVVSNQ
jgi:hypothetical protein